MPLTLENAALQFALSPATAEWSLFSRHRNGPAVEKARLAVTCRRGAARIYALEKWEPYEIEGPARVESPHGALEQLVLVSGPGQAGLRFTLTFAMPQDHPLLLWRIGVRNEDDRPVHMDRLEMLRVGYPRRSQSGASARGALYGLESPELRFQGSIHPKPGIGDLAFFSNGWQSWNYSGIYGQFDKSHQTRLGPLRAPMVRNAGTPSTRLRGHFTSEMFGVLGNHTHRHGILAGFLSQREHFGTLEAWLDPSHPSLRLWAHGDSIRLDPRKGITTDWACLFFPHLDNADPLGPYIEAVAREHGLPLFEQDIPTGWGSWYHYFENISAQTIQDNLNAAYELRAEAPLDIIQIDDGAVPMIGDWLLNSPRFPDGLAALADQIKDAGFKPGLWLAPFAVDPRSKLAHNHPGWLLRGRLGRPVNAGYSWRRLQTALDLTHPEALAYAAEVVHTAVHKWGYPFLKLDYLYVGALPGRHHDPTRTRAQILRAGLQAVRAAAGEDSFLLGCGCPLGPAIGLVDAMRVGADTSPTWDRQYRRIRFLLSKEQSIPAGINSVQGALARASLHRRWWLNDPDCLLLRPETSLSLAEVRTLATVNALTGGLLLVSDNLTALPADRRRLLGTLLPPIGKTPHILDWFENAPPARLQLDLKGPAGPWHLLAVFNWADRPQDLVIRLQDTFLDSRETYLARSFWTGETFRLNQLPLTLPRVPAHGVVLLAARRSIPRLPQYIGGDLHISQGLEVSKWEPSISGLQLQLNRPGQAAGEIELSLPARPANVRLNGEAIPAHAAGEGLFRFTVRFDRTADLTITW